MIEVNLLPWRQSWREKKRQQKKLFMIITVFLPMIFFISVHFTLGVYVENEDVKLKKLESQASMTEVSQENQNNEVADDIAELNQERNDLLQRLVALGQDGLSDVRLARMDYAQKKINVIGYVKSVTDMSQWVKKNKLDIEVTQIKKIPDTEMLKFQATVQ